MTTRPGGADDVRAQCATQGGLRGRVTPFSLQCTQPNTSAAAPQIENRRETFRITQVGVASCVPRRASFYNRGQSMASPLRPFSP
jgi:hypothetical protein